MLTIAIFASMGLAVYLAAPLTFAIPAFIVLDVTFLVAMLFICRKILLLGKSISEVEELRLLLNELKQGECLNRNKNYSEKKSLKEG